MRKPFAWKILFILVSSVAIAKNINVMDTCVTITERDLGERNVMSRDGLVADSLSEHSAETQPLIRVIAHHLTCLGTGKMRNTFSRMTVLVEYECLGALCPDPWGNNTTTLVDEFLIVCQQSEGHHTPIRRISRNEKIRHDSCNLDSIELQNCQICMFSLSECAYNTSCLNGTSPHTIT